MRHRILYSLPAALLLALALAGSALASVSEVGGSTYYLYGSGAAAADTTITLTSFKQPVNQYVLSMTNFGDAGYLTLEPGSATRQEFVSFTGITQNSDGTATLTGVTRGLSNVSPYTASTTLRKAHSGGTTAVISNSPQFYQRFAKKDSSETITGTWTFSAFPVTPSTPAATTLVAGFTTIATALQAGSTTASATGPSSTTYVIPTSVATDTPTYGCAVGYTAVAGAGCVVVSTLSGKISSSWIPVASTFAWTGPHTFSSTVTHSGATALNATTTVASTVSANVPVILAASSTPGIFNSNNASTTLWQYAMPANTLGKNDTLRIHTAINSTNCGGTSNMALFWGTGLATSTIVATSSLNTANIYTDTNLYNIGVTNSQDSDSAILVSTRPTAPDRTTATAAVDTTAKTFFALRYFCSNGSNAQLRNVTMEKLGSQ